VCAQESGLAYAWVDVTPHELAVLPRVDDPAALDVTLPPLATWSADGTALW
jgi:hypothetical protein